MDGMMNGMMGGMWIWLILGGLVVVALVVAVLKMFRS